MLLACAQQVPTYLGSYQGKNYCAEVKRDRTATLSEQLAPEIAQAYD